MAYNFLRGDRDQPFLLPPDLRDWLPPTIWPGSSATWSTSSTWHRSLPPTATTARPPAYDPKTLLGVLLYAYPIGVRSSRQIQRRCIEDLAFRVLAGNVVPDHVTIARFRVRHQQAVGCVNAFMQLGGTPGADRPVGYAGAPELGDPRR
jgi:Transposase domain (DUF772)